MKLVCVLVVAALSAPVAGAAMAHDKPAGADPRAAKDIFGHADGPADLKPQAYGGYTRGCLAGAKKLPAEGPAWQAMRLSRNRNWGHPALVAYLEKLADDARRLDGWPGLLVGDMAQPRGGPMLTGHASHQIGLDADIWLTPSPGRVLTRAERESMSAVSMVASRRKIDPKAWTEAQARLLRRAASYPQVARIFVHPPIKKALCAWATGDRGWLRKIRPWYGHTYHFHVRLRCPRGDKCKDQAAPPPGDGCGANLAWWLTDKPYAKRKTPPVKYKVVTLDDLPKPCRAVAGEGG